MPGIKHKTLSIPIEVWEWLRERAYVEKTSMVEVVRRLIKNEQGRVAACKEAGK